MSLSPFGLTQKDVSTAWGQAHMAVTANADN